MNEIRAELAEQDCRRIGPYLIAKAKEIQSVCPIHSIIVPAAIAEFLSFGRGSPEILVDDIRIPLVANMMDRNDKFTINTIKFGAMHFDAAYLAKLEVINQAKEQAAKEKQEADDQMVSDLVQRLKQLYLRIESGVEGGARVQAFEFIKFLMFKSEHKNHLAITSAFSILNTLFPEVKILIDTLYGDE